MTPTHHEGTKITKITKKSKATIRAKRNKEFKKLFFVAFVPSWWIFFS